MYNIIKRAADICCSFLALAVLSPILLPVCIVLLLTGEHEVFYFQERIGKGGRPFRLWKFATMLKNSPNMGTGDITTRNDPRVLPVGRFLRKTKINELPQLVNIFIGDMSVVGPRPLTRNNYNAYSDDVRACISRMTPGLSGVGSIVFRDEEAYVSRSSNPVAYYNERIAPVKGALEKWYFANRSLYVDAMVILLTVWAVVNPKSDLIYSVFPDLPRMETE